MIESKVICDSISEHGKRITTIQVKFHRFILPEFNTHRVFSRNFSSSRAIPTAKLLEQVRSDPAMPVYWGKNQPGMQAREELSLYDAEGAKVQWKHFAEVAAGHAESLAALGVHKQIVNRLIEPFLWVNGIVTSTEWDNFFDLRCHPDAQPEIQALAYSMFHAREASTPILLESGQWHLPYISNHEKHGELSTHPDKYILQKISAARCCRVSYLKHDGTNPSVKDDLDLYERLSKQVPIHASPMEHQATPSKFTSKYWGNFHEWWQFRKLIEYNKV